MSVCWVLMLKLSKRVGSGPLRSGVAVDHHCAVRSGVRKEIKEELSRCCRGARSLHESNQHPRARDLERQIVSVSYL
jgi:hypothetical protein